MPRSRSVSRSAGTIFSDGYAVSHSGARNIRGDVPRPRVAETDSEPLAEQAVADLLPLPLRRVEQLRALLGELVEPEAEALVELVVVRRAELLHGVVVDPRRLEVDRVELLVGQPQPFALESLAPVAVGLVRDRGAQHPERDLLAVDDGLELGLDLGEPLLMGARQVAEEALAGEAPQLCRRALEPLRRLELRQVLVALVDRLEVERLLVAGVVEIVLLVQFGDEAVGVVAERVQLAACQGLGGHGSVG